MQLSIKNMVCDRCIMVVKQILQEAGLSYKNIHLGKVELYQEPDENQLSWLKDKLSSVGFELLDDKKAALVDGVRSVIIDLIHGREHVQLNKKLSVLLTEKFGLDYQYLSTLFSSIEGVTIEKYLILQRIEKAKELLVYNELSLSEISERLGYSSVQHLSRQFKEVTGFTPSQFKALKENRRTPLDKVSVSRKK